MMSNIHQPHDKYIEDSLSNKTVAREFFDRLLPDKIRQLIDLDHLHLENTSFVDDDMKRAHCDLLFSTAFANKVGYLYLLLEHQHTVDPIMVIRLREYLCKIWRQHRKQHPNEPLPIIYPLVLYSGEKAYDQPMDLMQMFVSEQRDLAKSMYGLDPFVKTNHNNFSGS